MKLKGIFFWSNLIMICASIVGIVLLALTAKSYSYELPIYDDLKANFIQNPVSSISVQKTPCMHPLVPLLNLQWPGIKPFCSCWLYSYSGVCTSKQRNSGCRTKGNLPPAPLSKYKGIYICADKMSLDYDGLKEVKPGENCPEGTKVCGTSTENWNLCFASSVSCPINDLVFSATQREDLKSKNYKEEVVAFPQNNFTFLNNTTSVINQSNWYIYYTNTEVTKPIIVQFSLGYKKNICFHPQQTLAPIKQYKYLANEDNYKEECDTISGHQYDTRYSYLDSYNQYNLWTENGIIPLMNSLPDFDGQSLNYEVDLFKRGYVRINEECQYENSNKVFKLKSQIIDTLSFRFTSYNRTAYFTACFVLLSLAIIFGIICLCTVAGEKVTNCCHWFLGFIVFACVTTVLALTIVMYLKGEEREGQISKLQGKNCGDELTNSAIETSYFNAHRDSRYFLAVAGVLALGILLYVIYSVLKPCEKKKKYKPVQGSDPPTINTNWQGQAAPYNDVPYDTLD